LAALDFHGKRVIQFDTLSGTQIWEFVAGKSPEAVSTNPISGAVSFVVNAGIIHLDAKTGHEVGRFDPPVGSTYKWPLAASQDGKRLAVGMAPASISVLDNTSGAEIVRLDGHTSTVTDVEFSPDGRLLASGSYDGTARVWDGSSGRELVRYDGHDGAVIAVNFSPDGTRLATASYDDVVSNWLLSIEELVALARSRLTRTFTEEECRQYLHVEACPADVPRPAQPGSTGSEP
jgi:WD40 repeat protein